MKTFRPAHELAAVALAALALTFVAYGPALDAEFVSDDRNAIIENEWVVGPPNPAGIFGNFSWWGQGRSDLYRPLPTLTFLWNRLAGGLEPSGFRIVNYAWHAACATLLFALARMLALRREVAAVGAALFVLLPIHSEAVIWLVGRAELGAATGVLVAAMLCLRYRRGGSFALLPAAALATTLGTLCKENAATAVAIPLVFAATDFFRLGPASTDGPAGRTTIARDLTASAALLAGVAVYALLRLSAEGPAPNLAGLSMLDNPLIELPLGNRLLGAVAVLGRYLSLTFWPSSLSVDYSYDALGIGRGFVANFDTLVAVVFVAAAFAAVRFGPWRRDVVAIGLLLAAATFSIVSNTAFVIGTILGERLFYLPTAGLALAIAALVEPALAGTRRQRSAVLAACAIVAVAAIGVDRARAAEWRTPVSLFEATVRAVPRSARAHMELATAYGTAGRIADAKTHFEKSLAIMPDYSAASYNLGNMLARSGELDAAAAAYRRALETSPKFMRAWHNLSLTERMRGRNAERLEAVRQAATLAPGDTKIAHELGEALLAMQRYSEAITVYDRIIARGDANGAAYFNRGVARHNLEGCRTAVEDYRLATKVRDAPREAFQALSGCLRQTGGR